MSLEAALALARKSCRVFPIIKGDTGKKPGITRWQILATTQESRISAWWTRKFKDASVGIHPVGLIVIDVDGPEGHCHARRLDLPDTVKVISGNRNEPHHYHLYYRLPPGFRAIPKPLRKFTGFESFTKIDIKGSGGQLVGPGSVHPSGGVYRWDRDFDDIFQASTPAPSWMNSLLGPERPNYLGDRPQYAIGSDEEYVEVLTERWPIGKGNRHAQTASAMTYLVSKGLSSQRVRHIGLHWLARFKGVYQASDAEAFDTLHRTVDRTYEQLAAGVITLMTDHQQVSLQTPLRARACSWLLELLYPGPPQNPPLMSAHKRVMCAHLFSACSLGGNHTPHSGPLPRITAYSRFSEVDKAFLITLLAHANYEVVSKGLTGTLLMTDRQLMAIYKELTGRELSRNGYDGMKKKYYTRGGLKATLLELVKCVHSSKVIGRPSVYQLTGLWEAFNELPEHQDNPDPEVGPQPCAERASQDW